MLDRLEWTGRLPEVWPGEPETPVKRALLARGLSWDGPAREAAEVEDGRSDGVGYGRGWASEVGPGASTGYGYPSGHGDGFGLGGEWGFADGDGTGVGGSHGFGYPSGRGNGAGFSSGASFVPSR